MPQTQSYCSQLGLVIVSMATAASSLHSNTKLMCCERQVDGDKENIPKLSCLPTHTGTDLSKKSLEIGFGNIICITVCI